MSQEAELVSSSSSCSSSQPGKEEHKINNKIKKNPFVEYEAEKEYSSFSSDDDAIELQQYDLNFSFVDDSTQQDNTLTQKGRYIKSLAEPPKVEMTKLPFSDYIPEASKEENNEKDYGYDFSDPFCQANDKVDYEEKGQDEFTKSMKAAKEALENEPSTSRRFTRQQATKMKLQQELNSQDSDSQSSSPDLQPLQKRKKRPCVISSDSADED